MKDTGNDNNQNMQRQRLIGYITGFWVSQIVLTAVELGIFDFINNNISIESLKKRIKCRSQPLMKLLRNLESLELITISPNQDLAITDLGKFLLKESPASVYNFAKFMNAKSYFAWSKLKDAILNSKSGYQLFWGTNIYDFSQNNNNWSATQLNDLTGYLSSPIYRCITEKFDFTKYHNVIDVGGGSSGFTHYLVNHLPHLQVVCFDLPEVVLAKSQDLASNVKWIAGDFFQKVPRYYDVIVLMRVLHNWSNSKVFNILRNVRLAMSCKSKLLIIEQINYNNFISNLLDLNAFVISGGSIRQSSDIINISEKAGLKYLNSKSLDLGYELLEFECNRT